MKDYCTTLQLPGRDALLVRTRSTHTTITSPNMLSDTTGGVQCDKQAATTSAAAHGKTQVHLEVQVVDGAICPQRVECQAEIRVVCLVAELQCQQQRRRVNDLHARHRPVRRLHVVQPGSLLVQAYAHPAGSKNVGAAVRLYMYARLPATTPNYACTVSVFSLFVLVSLALKPPSAHASTLTQLLCICSKAALRRGPSQRLQDISAAPAAGRRVRAAQAAHARTRWG